MASYFRIQLESWLKTVNVKADKVLDIGGSANPVDKRVNSWDVKEYFVMDNNAEETFHTKWRKPDFVQDMNLLFDCWKEKERHRCQSFDVVFMLEVSEYLWNPLQALENVVNLLKDGGTFYASFATIYPLHNPPGIDYLRYTKNGVEKLLKEAGFSSWEIKPRVATDGHYNLQQFFSEERMRPMKGEEAVFDIGYLVKATK